MNLLPALAILSLLLACGEDNRAGAPAVSGGPIGQNGGPASNDELGAIRGEPRALTGDATMPSPGVSSATKTETKTNVSIAWLRERNGKSCAEQDLSSVDACPWLRVTVGNVDEPGQLRLTLWNPAKRQHLDRYVKAKNDVFEAMFVHAKLGPRRASSVYYVRLIGDNIDAAYSFRLGDEKAKLHPEKTVVPNRLL